MPKRNWPLTIGVALALVFAVLAIFGPALAPQDPLQTNLYLKLGGSIRLAPVAPGVVPGYWLGTDEAGRDVLSRILWGIRPTLVICIMVAVARVVVGTLVGLGAGWFRGTTERVIDAVGSIGIGLPALVLAIALIALLGVNGGFVTFTIALTVVGWIEVANLVKAQTLTIVQAPYVESARALGVRPWGILRRHLLPQLRPLLPVVLAFELSATLLLLTELGFLGIFIGGGTTYTFDGGSLTSVQVLTSDYPELGQQVSRFWTKFYRVPWEFLAVGAVIFKQIVAFNLVGEGLRRRLDMTQPRRALWRRLSIPTLTVGGARRARRWAALAAVSALLAVVVVMREWSAPTQQVQNSNPSPTPVAAIVGVVPPPAATGTPSIPPVASAPAPASTMVAEQPIVPVDLEALLTQPDVLPAAFTVQQVSKRVPDILRAVPEPVAVQSATLRSNDGTAAVTVLQYGASAQRDQAVSTMIEAVTKQNTWETSSLSLPTPQASPSAGSRAFIVDQCSIDDNDPELTCTIEAGTGSLLSTDMFFERCSAAVQVRVSTTTSLGQQEAVVALAQAVDAAISPVVCRS